MPTLLPLHRLRHPNVMTDAERLALPDPRRPIDAPSDMVNHAWHDWLHHELIGTNPIEAADFAELANPAQIDNLDEDNLPYHNLTAMLHEQRRLTQAATDPYAWRLPLTWLPAMVERFAQALFNELWQTHPDAALWAQVDYQGNLPPDTMTWRLLVAKHRYAVMLCVWALCQCRTRQSINPRATLQVLADALTVFADERRQIWAVHHRERNWQILPSHVELALYAIDVQVTKTPTEDIAKRRSAIAAHSPLKF